MKEKEKERKKEQMPPRKGKSTKRCGCEKFKWDGSRNQQESDIRELLTKSRNEFSIKKGCRQECRGFQRFLLLVPFFYHNNPHPCDCNNQACDSLSHFSVRPCHSNKECMEDFNSKALFRGRVCLFIRNRFVRPYQ